MPPLATFADFERQIVSEVTPRSEKAGVAPSSRKIHADNIEIRNLDSVARGSFE